MKKLLIAIVLLLISISCAVSQQESFDEALGDYNNGDYNAAIILLEELLSQDQESTELYYNLGLCYLKTDQLGLGIVNLHRALLISPQHQETLAALSIAQQRVSTPITEIPDFILNTMIVDMANSLDIGTWAVIQLLSIMIVLIISYVLLFRHYKRGYMFGGLILFSLIALWSYYNADLRKNLKKSLHSAVIAQESTDIYQGADDRSEVITIVGEGVVVEIKDQLSDWYKVELKDKDTGWVQIKKVITI